MVAINNAGDMFARFNKDTKANEKNHQILDSNEIARAKQSGFDFFELKENITDTEFMDLYDDYAAKQNQVEFAQKERNIHVKYLQLQYGTDEPIGEDENLGDYEERLKNNITKSDVEQPATPTPIKNNFSV